ncbi:MAG: tRNA (guanosine(46)-N7)-methyltransferase TrmB [Methylobacteriaceae bacterium]|nr:tRNA (guanosine(46)-N7)-methyltransferase TrmB [Methylobacteriaceae bacterium]
MTSAGPQPRTFHGRRKGKALRPGQARLLDTLLPQLAIDVARPLADPKLLFPRPVRAVRLEIGFGGGEHLVAEAARHPGLGFLGCEPFVNGLAKTLHLIEASGLANVRLHPGEVGPLIDALPQACLCEVDLLYPDPWPKRRQRKRRLVSDAMLGRLARVMEPGAELRFATDIDDYAGWTLARILRSPDFEWAAQRASDWLLPWPGWTGTRYEAKAKGEGRAAVYLTFRRR